MVKNLLLTLLGLIVLAALVIALIASQRPDTFRVSRSATIAAPADRLFPLINNLREFNTWNPYSQKDPQMKSSYSGPAHGPGARSDFRKQKCWHRQSEDRAGHAAFGSENAPENDGADEGGQHGYLHAGATSQCDSGDLDDGRPRAIPRQVHGGDFQHVQDGGRRLRCRFGQSQSQS